MKTHPSSNFRQRVLVQALALELVAALELAPALELVLVLESVRALGSVRALETELVPAPALALALESTPALESVRVPELAWVLDPVTELQVMCLDSSCQCRPLSNSTQSTMILGSRSLWSMDCRLPGHKGHVRNRALL